MGILKGTEKQKNVKPKKKPRILEEVAAILRIFAVRNNKMT